MNTSKDIPAPLAAILLIGVFLALLSFSASGLDEKFIANMEIYFSRHWLFLSALSLSSTVNLYVAVAYLRRLFALSGQGAKLKRLRKSEKNELNTGKATAAIILFLLCGLFPAHFLSARMAFAAFSDLRLFNLNLDSYWFSFFTIATFFLNLLPLFRLVKAIFPTRQSTNGEDEDSIPERPIIENGLCLGTVNESSADQKPIEWAVMNRRALNGNILVTGSIGSGKTSGTILPYLKQILQNFAPTPSMLLIDPKGTFLREARDIIKKAGHEGRIFHIHLNGNVSFNPIFTEKALRQSKFLEIAQMIRAAATNYIGKQFDSPFWEISAFNLMKNALVYCAATKEYYTLRDLYETMNKATKNDLFTKLIEIKKANDQKSSEIDQKKQKLEELKKITSTSTQLVQDIALLAKEIAKLEAGLLDSEEIYNIECATEYFQNEYRQLEDKVKTGILATSTSFLNQFQEFRAAQIFCPKKDDLTIRSMDELVDSGKIILFDITTPALAKSMGTFIKLHYQQALLNRLSDPTRDKSVSGVIIIDEYQDVVTVSSGSTIGDEKCLAKGREANTITIAATQSYSTLENAIGRDKATKELIQNFRTKIACHSADLSTIRLFQELVGKEEKQKTTHNISEISQHTSRNYLIGGFDAKDANITESYSTTPQKDYELTGREFSSLQSFESVGFIYDGMKTRFEKVFLKPHFLEKPNTPHKKVIEMLASSIAAIMIFFSGSKASAFPNVCSVVKTKEFKSCLDFNVSGTLCGWPVPRPCARISYWVPETFVEVHPNPGETYFKDLPGARFQLSTIKNVVPFGVEADLDTQSYHSHVLSVPLTTIPFSLLPCGGARLPKMCFDAMSEHVGNHWATGQGDLLQPLFLAWSASPKACLMAGALSSATGGSGTRMRVPDSPMCSVPLPSIAKYLTYQPSTHPACNGWGTFYPRYGTYSGPASLTGSLMIASRMRSLATEVFRSTPSNPDEKWQMITPQSSSCFREGQNMGVLELGKSVQEIGRLRGGGTKGHLFVLWKQVSCKQEWPAVPAFYAAIEAMSAVCRGL